MLARESPDQVIAYPDEVSAISEMWVVMFRSISYGTPWLSAGNPTAHLSSVDAACPPVTYHFDSAFERSGDITKVISLLFEQANSNGVPSHFWRPL